MTNEEMECIIQFSLFKYFDAILDAVEQDGLSALEQPEIKKALAELGRQSPAQNHLLAARAKRCFIV